MFRGQNWLKNNKNGHFWGDFCVFGVKLDDFGLIFSVFLGKFTSQGQSSGELQF